MQMNKEELEKQYREIASLYDTAEELAGTVESEFVQDPHEQLALVEPLINQVADCADVLSEEFVSVLEKPVLAKTAKGRVEGALRKMFVALQEYRTRLGLKSKDTLEAIANIADPIIAKLRKQIDKIILIFMRLMEISLERIMQKYEIEEFRRTNDRAMAGLPLGH